MAWLETKIPPPAVALILGLGMWGLARVTPRMAVPDGWRWAGAIGIFLAGLVLALAAVAAFRSARTTVNPVHPEAATTLVTGGVFGLTRNPMYVSLTLLLGAVAVLLAAPAALLGPVVFVAYITRFQIVPEERVMRAKFGAAYEAYAGRVRRWV